MEWTGALRHWRRTLLAVVALPAVALWGGESTWTVNAFFGLYVAVTVVLLSTTFEHVVRRRSGTWRTLLALEGASVVSAFAYGAIGSIGAGVPLLAPEAMASSLAKGLTDLAIVAQFILAYWVIVYVFPYAADDARLRAIEADRMRRAAELAQLRANLEPHFLLNTLNAIAGLVSQDPKEARRLIACLGDLLRDALSADGEQERLGDQIEWLQRYAEILESRHREALRFTWEIDERARSVRVPRLLLQPLVENAVSHGALRREGGGHVLLRTSVVEGPSAPTLVCEVQDDGPGIESSAVRSGAKGLVLVRSRLESMHPAGRLRLESASPGARVIVEIPLERDAVEPRVT